MEDVDLDRIAKRMGDFFRSDFIHVSPSFQEINSNCHFTSDWFVHCCSPGYGQDRCDVVLEN